MDWGLNNHLKRISSELLLKPDSQEGTKIARSLDSICKKLDDYFDDEIDESIIFGSYTRDTILPRQFDIDSDIDILVQFNTDSYEKIKPESYRTRLKKFAEAMYPKSVVIKDHPSIVIELNYIKFDLVPTIFDKGYFYDSIEIPSKNGGWMETEPDKFNKKLLAANKRFGYVVKPIIRMIKYWNASQGYPFASYELEKIVAEMDFSNDNHESGFLYAARRLPKYGLSQKAQNSVSTLKSNADWIEEYIKRQDLVKARQVVSRVLPGF